MELEKELVSIIKSSSKNIVITCHKSPDGDAIGSSLGLYHFLKTLNHKAQVIVPDNFPDFLKWMPGIESAILYANDKKKAQKAIDDAEVIFYLDFNELSRVGKGLDKSFAASNAFKIMIDHHTNPADIADITISDKNACATAELIYQLIEEMGYEENINSECATCLYSGILTDSGSFRFASTKALTFQIASKLIEKGAENAKIYSNIFDNYSENRLRLTGFILKDKLKLLPEYHTAIISLTQEELSRYKYKKGDTEGLVNYPLSISEIILSIIIMEKDGKVKMSLRSKGNFKANELAQEYFNGGGHVNAAGGLSKVPAKETIELIKDILPKYKKQLNDAFKEIS